MSAPQDAPRAHQGHPSLRIGLLPVLTLIAVLSLATLAVLAISTSRAAAAIATRQEQATSDAYLLESAGQRFLAQVDETADTGVSVDAAQLANAAAADACNAASAEGAGVPADAVTASAQADGSTIQATFSTGSGRTLAVTLELVGGEPTVTTWQLSTVQEDASTNTLWSGTTDDGTTTTLGTTGNE